MRISSVINLYALLLLSENSKHGYELIKEISVRLGRKVSPSQVYPFLRSLEKNKLVASVTSRTRDKKDYKLTPKGKKLVGGLISSFSAITRSAISSNLLVCAHCSAQVYGKAFFKKIGNKKVGFCCKYCADSLVSP